MVDPGADSRKGVPNVPPPPGADSGGGAPGARPPKIKKKRKETVRERERRRGEGKQGGKDTFNKRKNVCRSICNIFLTFSDRLLNAT